MTAPSQLVQVGIVKEAAYGAGGAPSLLLPSTAPSGQDKPGLMADAGWRGAPATAYQQIVGPLASALTLGGPVFMDGIGFPLAGLLGDVAFAGGTPNTWTMACLNSGTQQPPSYAVTIGDPIGKVQYPGCRFASLDLAFDPNQLLSWSATLAGLPGVVSAVAMPALSAEKVTAGWVGVAKVGGVVEARVLTATMKIARSVLAKRNVTGQLAPYLQRSEELTVSGAMTLVAATDAYRQDLLAGTTVAVELSFATGAGAAARQLLLHCSAATLTQADRAYGQRWIELDLAFTTSFNTSDVGASGGYSPIKATVKNAVASGVYA